ncbi:MAG: DUF5050 domain-containing protein [Clostridiales bacterium]|nr:DUF5050 domain-containing protein [Clostridiales bacterium]
MKNKAFVTVNKRIISFILLAVLGTMSLFSGCGTNDDAGSVNTALSSSTMPDFQYMFKLNGAAVPTQKSDSGYYNVLSGTIIYTDAETLASTPLCNKTDCLHTSDFEDCNAKINDLLVCFDSFQIYRDQIYYISTGADENSDEDRIYLKSISLDGAERSTVLTFTDKFICDWFIYDGFFYYQTTIDIESGDSQTMSSNFYRVDLSTKSEETFIDFSEFDGLFGVEGSLRNIYDNYMYLTLYGYSSEDDYNKLISGEETDDSSAVIKIIKYNLSDGSCAEIDPYNNDYDFIGFSDGKLVGADYGDETKKICITELDGSNPKEIIEVNNLYKVYCDDDYIYIYNQSDSDSSDGSEPIEVYDKEGNKISEAYLPQIAADNIDFTAFYDDYLWFSYTDEDNDGNTVLCCLDKSQFLNNQEECTYQEVYRYE